MSNKILVLNGSPRKNGNTAALIREFSRGARETGNSVVSFMLHDMNIKGCRGCWAGGKSTDRPCTINDDMDKIYPVYRESDVVVLSSPVYYWNISGQLKTAFDRLYATAECTGGINPSKKAVLLMAAIEEAFDESVQWYNSIMKNIGWTDLGKVLVPGVQDPGDIEGNQGLVTAYQLGKSINNRPAE